MDNRIKTGLSRMARAIFGGGETRARTGPTFHPSNAPPGMTFFGGSGDSAAGVNVTERTSLSLSAVFGCVRNIAEDVAKLPFKVYETDPSKPGRKNLPESDYERLINREPNDEMTPLDFRQAVTACACLWGNGYAEIERKNNRRAAALWPLEPWRVVPQRVGGPNGDIVYLVDGRTEIPAADMLHIKGFGIDGVLGLMLAEHGRDSFSLAMAAQRFAGRFFANGVRFSGFIKHPGLLNPEAYARLKESFEQKYSGVDNAHKPKILEEGTDWVQTSSKPNEAQMLETRQFSVEDVARWFRVSPHKIGHLLRAAGWSTLEAQNTDYIIDTLMAWFVRWEQECNRKLVVEPLRGTVVGKHDVLDLLRGDAQQRAEYYKTMREIGAINVNEIRGREDMNPIKDGELYFVSSNMVTLKQAKEGTQEGITPKQPEQTGKQPAPVPGTKKPAAKKPKPAAGGKRSAPEPLADTLRPVLLDAGARAARREAEVLRKKIKSVETAEGSIRDFYAAHGQYVRNVILPGVTACAGGRDPSAIADRVVAVYVSQSQTNLIDHMRSVENQAQLADKVDAVLGAWETQRAAIMADLITQEVKQ